MIRVSTYLNFQGGDLPKDRSGLSGADLPADAAGHQIAQHRVQLAGGCLVVIAAVVNGNGVVATADKITLRRPCRSIIRVHSWNPSPAGLITSRLLAGLRRKSGSRFWPQVVRGSRPGHRRGRAGDEFPPRRTS